MGVFEECPIRKESLRWQIILPYLPDGAEVDCVLSALAICRIVFLRVGGCEIGIRSRAYMKERVMTATGTGKRRWPGNLKHAVILTAAMVISAEVALAAGNLPTPEARSLTADEAAKAIEHDWLFQAGDVPSVWRTRQEIQWTRQLAARLAGRPKPPDLSAELKELDEIERQLPDEATLAAQPPLRLPEGLVARWTFDEPGGNVIADASGGGWQGTLAGRTQTVPGIRGGSLALGGLGYMTTDPKLSAITQESYTVSTSLPTTAS